MERRLRAGARRDIGKADRGRFRQSYRTDRNGIVPIAADRVIRR
jgi:hypothetical protein